MMRGAPDPDAAFREFGPQRPAQQRWRSGASPLVPAEPRASVASRRRVEFVAGAPDHFEVTGSARVALDLFAQATDVHRYGGRTAAEILIPNGVEQVVAAEHLAWMRHQ